MSVTLWIIAGLMATAFLASGALKLALPKQKVVASGADFLGDLGPGTIKLIGLLEVSAAVGLVLPALVDIAPVLVPLAAVGLALMVAVACVARLRIDERAGLYAHLVVIGVLCFVAWGRLGPETFTG